MHKFYCNIELYVLDEPDCHMPASPAFPVNGIGGFEIYDETKESNSKQPAFQIYDENQENK